MGSDGLVITVSTGDWLRDFTSSCGYQNPQMSKSFIQNNLGTSSCILLGYLQIANAQNSINAKNMLILSYMFGANNVCHPPTLPQFFPSISG